MKKFKSLMLLMMTLMFSGLFLSDGQSALARAGTQTVSTTIKAWVTMDDGKLDNRRFSFKLMQNGYTIQTANSDPNTGEVRFQPVYFSQPGEYTFKIVQTVPQDNPENLKYDESERTVTVKVTQHDLTPVDPNIKYYGTTIDATGKITMGEVSGGASFNVFCINQHKTLPPSTANNRTYTVVKDPTNEQLEQAVTHNLYGSNLAYRLKQIFFYFQAFPNEYNAEQQRQIVWAATGAYGSTQDSTAQYGPDLEKIFKTELPTEYHLVMFNPDEAPDEKGIYQSLATGYGAAITSGNNDLGFTASPALFINKKPTKPVQPPVENQPGFNVALSKVEKGSDKFVAGASMRLVQGEGLNGNVLKQWTSADQGKVVMNLAAGTYTLIEDAAPNGYKVANPVVFRVDDQGHVQIKKNNQWETTTHFSDYEAYTNQTEYGDELDGAYVDNIYVRPIGGNDSSVAYCFNYNKRVPAEAPDNLKEGTYTKREEKDFLSMTNGSKIQNNDQLVQLIKTVLWKGYPNNQAGLQGNISNEKFRALTQAAVWLFTNDVRIQDIQYFQGNLSAEEQKVYNELTNGNATLPQDFKLNVYEASNKDYQNIVGTNYVKGPEKVPEVKMEDEKTDKPKNDLSILIKKAEKGTDNAVIGAHLQIFKEGTQEVVGDLKTDGSKKEFKLEDGTYRLKETEAPSGYQKADDIVFKVEKGKLYLKEGNDFVESQNFEEIALNNYEAFADRNDDSYSWGFTPYGKHYYLKENGGKGQVLYCFNIDRHEPAESYDDGATIEYNPFDGGEVKYTKIVNPSKLVTYTENPRIKDPMQFYEKIKKVIYAGYPNNHKGLQGSLTATEFKTATQLAIYYFTDNIDPKTIGHGFEGINTPEGAKVKAVFDKLIAYAENNEKAPGDYRLNMFSSNNGKYQNLIGTQVSDKDLLYTITMEDEKGQKPTPLEPAKTSVKVQKAWKGKDAATMPEVTVHLVKNGKRTDQSIKLNKDNNWSGSFNDLPTVDNITDKDPNVYTVEEDNVKDGKVTLNGNVFAVATTGSAKDGFTLTNTYQPTEKEVTFSKVEV
ncbi:MAG: thioester-forming surface-anchored protein, partial [Aerococcus sp.]|nr:thioester-forming surface-anchored protein [Aerococcus sp.]